MALKRLLAFAAIYLLWGVSFLAIREVVAVVPPFLAAAVRFAAAGTILFALARSQGSIQITRAEFFSGLKLGAFMFAGDYGCLFWAEQRLPSGIAAVISATIPMLIFCGDWMIARTTRPSLATGLGTAAGFAGIVMLVRPAPGQNAQLIRGLVAFLGVVFWAAGTLWSRRLPLPKVKTVSAGLQMLLGGLCLFALSLLAGELQSAHWFEWLTNPKVVAGMLYLTVAASVIAFTSYVWLLSIEPATRVATYAYVNPIVAVLVGFVWGGERFSPLQVAGMVLILAGVAAIMFPRAAR